MDNPNSILLEFERELDQLHRKCDGRLDREINALLLMALEREEMVSVSYRNSLMHSRLAEAQIPEDMKELIERALLWIWKDEETHAIYVRGLLLKRSRGSNRFAALLRQCIGAIGGWSSSVLFHMRWSQAPASYFLASTISGMGIVTRKVPTEVQKHLHYVSFRDYCSFNVHAEKTAWLCWDRLAGLADSGHIPDSKKVKADFKRIAEDELNHGEIFELLAESFQENGTIVEGVTTGALRDRINAVGPSFIPRSMQLPGFGDRNPTGTGGDVFVLEDDENVGAENLLRKTLVDSGLVELLKAAGAQSGKSLKELTVAIKTAFMLGYHKADLSPIVPPRLIEVLVEFLRENGVANVSVLECRNLYDRIYHNRSVADVAAYFGYCSALYSLVDCSLEQVPHSFEHGMAQYSISRSWKEADFRISFGKLRSHPTDSVHLSIGNLDALGTRCDEFIFLERQAHLDTATVMIADQFPPHFALLDAYENIPDGIVGVMGCKLPKSPRRFYAGVDALSLDIVASRHMGIVDHRSSSMLRTACEWFGDPSSKIRVIGTDKRIPDWRGPFCDDISTALALIAYPVYELGSARGSLFVPEMDEVAFPPLNKPAFSDIVIRRMVREILGLRGIVR